jgi:hypothetical protein
MNISSGAYLPRVWAGSQLSSRLLPTNIRPLSANVKLTQNCQTRCVSCDYWKTRWTAVGSILKNSLREILESEAYRQQAVAMVRRECPGCTCGIESSLAMKKNAISSAFFELKRLVPNTPGLHRPLHG